MSKVILKLQNLLILIEFEKCKIFFNEKVSKINWKIFYVNKYNFKKYKNPFQL